MPVFRAVVDYDRCAGVTMCLQAAPGAFALNGDGQSEFQAGDWDGSELAEAADECPMSAITVLRDGQEVP
jgi:ferredoxin